MMTDMRVNIAGVELKNPVMTASGTFGSGEEYSEFVDLNRLGAVVTKGVANVPWPGNATPRVAETYGGMMNAIGLQNPHVVMKQDDVVDELFDKVKAELIDFIREHPEDGEQKNHHLLYSPSQTALTSRSL